SADGSVRLWDAKTGQQLYTFEADAKYAAFSPDGNYIAAIGDGSVWSWEIKMSQSHRAFNGYDSEIWSVAYSPDGKYVATGSGTQQSHEHTARILNADTGEEVRLFDGCADR